MVVGFGFFATLKTDRDSLDRQRTFVTSGIADETAELVRQQTSVTVWDDFVVAARNGDQVWMAENLGEWMHSYYGQDRVYVLDAAGRPIHAMQDGKTAARPPPSRTTAPRSSPRSRNCAPSSGRRPMPDSPPPLVVSDLVSFGGVPAILAVQPIVPNSDRVAQEPGTEYVHASVQFVDGEVIDGIARQYQLARHASVAAAHLGAARRQRSADGLHRRHPRLRRLGPRPPRPRR